MPHRLSGVFPQGVPNITDVEVQKGMWKEYYQRFFPKVVYKSLRDDLTQRDWYGQTPHAERKYTIYNVHMRVEPQPSDETINPYGSIEERKTYEIFLCFPGLRTR